MIRRIPNRTAEHAKLNMSDRRMIIYTLLERAYGKGARGGHLSATASDCYIALQELGIKDGEALSRYMSKLTYKVEG